MASMNRSSLLGILSFGLKFGLSSALSSKLIELTH